MNTNGIIKDLKQLEDIIEFSNLDENHELFSIKNKKVIGKFIIWIDEVLCSRSKAYSFKCWEDVKNKTKDISKSQTKHCIFDEFLIRLDGGEYQKECDNQLLRSINHEIYLQKLKMSTLSIFDDKWCYINETENKPWNKY